MIKPTPEQVEEYAKSIGFKIDGEHFCDFYEMRGWVVAPRTPMSNWKAAVRTWKRNEQKWAKANGNEYETDGAGPDEFELLRKAGCA